MSARQDTAIRDIPRSCQCRWKYLTGPARWVRCGRGNGCIWHRGAAA